MMDAGVEEKVTRRTGRPSVTVLVVVTVTTARCSIIDAQLTDIKMIKNTR